jgi:hypothetical protein
MRFLLSCLVTVSLSAPVGGEQVRMQLEWGFGKTPCELYWDGQVRVVDGQLLSMQAVSFEPDRHDRLTPPTFQSLTVNAGTDGLDLVVEGQDQTAVRFESRQGDFQWTLGELRRRGPLSFAAKEQGRLVVRLVERLGEAPGVLSNKATQDSDPAICRLSDGRQLILWRAFLGLPARAAAGADSAPGTGRGGDQIRGVLLDPQGQPGPVFDVLDVPGDVENICLAPLKDGSCLVIWSEQRERNWDLYSRTLSILKNGIRSALTVRLTEDPGVDKTPAVAVLPDGSLGVVWQGWRDSHSRVFLRLGDGHQWQEPQCLSDAVANDWDPAVAASAAGDLAVGWSRWENGSYDVCLRVRSEGRWSPTQRVAATERFEAHPSLAWDAAGTLWIAYEEGQAQWGLDSHNAGLRSQRNVRLSCWRQGRLELPRGSAAWALPEAFRNISEMALLSTDERGVVWLFFRSLQRRGVWEIFGTSLGDQWFAPQKLDSSAGGQNVRMAVAPGADGRLRVAWCSDHRVDPVGRESWIYTSRLPARAQRTRPVETEQLPATTETKIAQRGAERPAWEFQNRRWGLYFGDLHRHTELSVCLTGVDGSLEDAYRYAIDAAELDFLCVTDHVQHVKILDDYDFWRTGKTADLHRVAGLHQPFYGYERSQRFPLGHRNIISLRRDVRRVPRTADNRPWDANSSYPGERLLTPPELWARLVGENAVTIPHTSTSPVMGTDFAFAPDPMEPVIEIYQGCRYTSEHADAPDPRPQRDAQKFGGAVQAAGYIWEALAKGYRYGFIASSDHVATHNSYTCVWADAFTNPAMFEALAKRRCYAATDKIACRMHMGPHCMGSEFAATEVPPLEIEVVGTTELDRIDVVKDNKVVYSRQPETPSREARFQYRDLQAEPGTHYYYARVIQRDRNMAWLSPIWVEVKPAARP